MYKISKIIILLILLLNSCIQEKNPVIPNVINHCSLCGFVFDDSTNEPIPGAKINVIDQKDVFSDSTGYFYLDSIVCGQLTISVTKNFYEKELIQLSIKKPDSISTNIFLTPLRIITYRVYSTVTNIWGNPNLDISIGDNICGYFAYEMDSEDTNPSPSIGYYYQYDKLCRAEFEINNTLYKNSKNQDTLFLVSVVNNYENPFYFEFYDQLYFGPFRDFQLRDSLLLSELRFIVVLKDHSSSIINDDKLFREINYEAFDSLEIFVHGIKTQNDLWTVYAEIDSLIFDPSVLSF